MSRPRFPPGRAATRPHALPAGILDERGEVFPNVVVLPRRLRRFGSWAELLASYSAGPAEPAKVLAFVRPGAPPTEPPGIPAKPVPNGPPRWKRGAAQGPRDDAQFAGAPHVKSIT